MPNVFPLVSVVAVALTGLTDPDFVARCVQPQRLALKSAYSEKPLIDGARQVRLTLTLDDKGNGTGVLSFDPNINHKWGTTEMAIREVPVQVRLRDEQDGKGPRLYDVTGREEGAASERWVLVRPLKGGSPSWLMFVDKDGKLRDAVLVE